MTTDSDAAAIVGARAARENGKGSQTARLAYAAVFATISCLILPWPVAATWWAALAIWEIGAGPVLDWSIARHSDRTATNVYAVVNVVGASLFHVVAAACLTTGTPLGMAIAATWLGGAFMNNFVYYGAYPKLLWTCLIPGIVIAVAAPQLAPGGPTIVTGAVSLVVLTMLLAVRQFSSDHSRLQRRLADRQFAIANLERKLAVAVEASGDGLFEVDFTLPSHQSTVDDNWRSMLGYRPDELQRPIIIDFVHPEDRPGVEAELAAHLSGKTPHTSSEQRLRCKDGSYKWVLWRARLVSRTADGRPWKMVGTIIDISARKALEHQLEAARDAAERGNAAKSTFVANMSHEIRTPLNGVIGVAGALARTPLSADQREMVDLVQSSAQILERLLSDVLDVSKLEAGEFELQTAPFDLRHAVDAAAELMRPRAEEKALGFQVSYGDGATGRFEGDAVRLRQIVTNLTANAIKFTEAGAVRIALAVDDTDHEASLVTLTVSDTGIGFDAETAERLFGRFVQADGSISRRFGGTGLGLAISKTLAERMGGDITASSSPGQGATFTVTLPMRRASAAAAPVIEAASDFDLDGLRVLLAEDHPTNQRVVQLILEPLGVHLTIVGDGAQAIEAFEREAFELVLMDMQMPVVDGLTATRGIRARESATGRAPTPLAMLTANAMEEHRQMAADAGADALIAKPITPQSLVEGVLAAVAGGRGDEAPRAAATPAATPASIGLA